jgi:3',5'-cyclic AMP phosphodiesterase CpdA
MATIAHLSDLHLGSSESAARIFEDAVERLEGTDLVVVTGDLTDRGRRAELAAFQRLARPLGERLVIVPGNHDRCGDDVGATFMGGTRVELTERDDVAIVRIDSTAPHNRIAWLSHGRLCEHVLERVDRTLARVSPGALVVAALHHHVVPLPAEGFWEKVSEALELPNHSELSLGTALLKTLRGRCDLVLHGHRHVPRQFVIDPESDRPMRVFNAGSTTELGAYRVFEHHGGRLLTEGVWRHVAPIPSPSPHVRPAPLHALQLA